MTTPLTIRAGKKSDRPALRLLAELDSARPLEGPVVLAEHEGRAIAAVGLDEERAIADPFRPTADVVELLRSWASQARAA